MWELSKSEILLTFERKKMKTGDLSQSLQSLNAQIKNLYDEYKKKERKLGIN